METFETEKHWMPQGATHYSNETEVRYFSWFMQAGDDEWYVQTRGDKGEWVLCRHREHIYSNVIEIENQPINPEFNIDTIATQTPEEKEALDQIDNTAAQVESLADGGIPWMPVDIKLTKERVKKVEASNPDPKNNEGWEAGRFDCEPEWKNGDACEYKGDRCFFVGSLPVEGSPITGDCIVQHEGGAPLVANVVELSKPESPEAKEERERLEAAEELYYTYMSQWENCQRWSALDQKNKDAFLAIVDKTKYRKGE